MKDSAFTYLRPEDIRRLSSYAFAPKLVVEGYYSGRHRSKLRGASTEFADYRPYVPGDDIAFIDWRVYARTDRPYLRTFLQETNTDCHIFLDSSASMGFGHSVTKLEYASFFTASLAWLTVRGGDRVSLLTFDTTLREFYPLGSTTRHLHHILNALEKNKPGSPTSLPGALQKAYPLLKQKGSLVIVSDFFDDVEAIFAALSPYIHRGFRIYLFQILDPEELELKESALRTFIDMETNARIIAHTADVREAYQTEFENHTLALRQMAVRRRAFFQRSMTNHSFLPLFDCFTA